MALHPRAGQPAQPEQLVNLEKLEQAYYGEVPDPSDLRQQVSFGTSGHRGSSLRCTFNEAHILAITQAICEYRTQAGTTGPLFIGRDTHAPLRTGSTQRTGGAGRKWYSGSHGSG
jgi:phosphoglucomutase